jgi:hypothetical protein
MTLSLYQLPHFTVIQVSTDNGLSFVGAVTTLSGVGEGYAYLYVDDSWIEGRLSQLDVHTLSAVFHPSNPDDAARFGVGNSYPCLDGYWGQLARLVFDQSKQWKRTQFEPADSTRFFENGRREVVPGGWDHEHCAICSEKISVATQAYGYRDEQDTWVCEHCYQHYVVPRSLAFVEV